MSKYKTTVKCKCGQNMFATDNWLLLTDPPITQLNCECGHWENVKVKNSALELMDDVQVKQDFIDNEVNQ